MTTEVKQLFDEQMKVWNEGIEKLQKQLNDEVAKFGAGSAETKQALENAVKEMGEKVEAARKAATERADKIETDLKKSGFLGGIAHSNKSAGELVIANDGFKTYAQKAREGERVSVTVPGLFTKANESLTTGAGSGAALFSAYRIPGIISPAERILTIRDLLNATTIDVPSVEYVRRNYFGTTGSNTGVGAAGMVSEGAAKPQAKVTYELVSDSSKTIAHWLHVSRKMLRSASFIRSQIDGDLTYGVKYKEEEQLLFGDGLGQNLTGLTDGAQAYDRYTSGDTKIDSLRRAITMAQLAEYPATAVVLNPEDWEAIELQKVGDSDNRYVFADPHNIQAPRIWGLPVVVTQSMNAGEFLVGAFGLGAQLFDVENVVIRFSESDQDDFIKNMVKILVEEDLILVNTRPDAFVYGEFGVGS